MATEPVRGLDDAVDDRPVARTTDSNRSPQVDMATARAAAAAMRQRLAGRQHGGSGEILTEERLR